jgi:hypothetical protein
VYVARGLHDAEMNAECHLSLSFDVLLLSKQTACQTNINAFAIGTAFA